jgi:hypothetical protein
MTSVEQAVLPPATTGDEYGGLTETEEKGAEPVECGEQQPAAESQPRKDAHFHGKQAEALFGCTVRLLTGCGWLYVTVNHTDWKPVEVLARLGKSGGCAASQVEGISRLVSLLLQGGVRGDSVVRELKGICCHRARVSEENEDDRVLSCADAIGKALEAAQMHFFIARPHGLAALKKG